MTRCLWRPISIFMAWLLMLCNGNRTQNALPPTFFFFFGQSLGALALALALALKLIVTTALSPKSPYTSVPTASMS